MKPWGALSPGIDLALVSAHFGDTLKSLHLELREQVPECELVCCASSLAEFLMAQPCKQGQVVLFPKYIQCGHCSAYPHLQTA